MQDNYITNIQIIKVRHLKSLDIALSQSECKHLILTGKNGSGKTSLLEAMRECIANAQHAFASGFLDDVNTISTDSSTLKKNGICISFSQKLNCFDNLIFVYIPARRNKLIVPNAIKTVIIEEKSQITTNANQMFLSYILGLDYQLYGAKSDNNVKLENNLTKWFDNFTNALRNIFDCPKLMLKRDTKNLAFIVEMPGREPFALNEMSDGYAAYFNIIMELLMRMEDSDAVVDYEKSAIVLIDEIEAHLHVDMQKRVLPFLTQMFPNVQFIIATHSPFVMTSLENAFVFDLEKRECLEKPS